MAYAKWKWKSPRESIVRVTAIVVVRIAATSVGCISAFAPAQIRRLDESRRFYDSDVDVTLSLLTGRTVRPGLRERAGCSSSWNAPTVTASMSTSLLRPLGTVAL